GTWGALFQSRLCTPRINSNRDRCVVACVMLQRSQPARPSAPSRYSATDVIAADGWQVGNALKHAFIIQRCAPRAIHLGARSGSNRTKKRELTKGVVACVEGPRSDDLRVWIGQV